MTTIEEVTRDYTHAYEDEGCWVHPKCLECPLPKCVEEMTGTEIRSIRRMLKRKPGLIYSPTEQEVQQCQAEGMTRGQAVQFVADRNGWNRAYIYKVIRQGR